MSTPHNGPYGARIPVGLDSWARCLVCGGYLGKTGEDERTTYARCEGCGEATELYRRRRTAAPGSTESRDPDNDIRA